MTNTLHHILDELYVLELEFLKTQLQHEKVKRLPKRLYSMN